MFFRPFFPLFILFRAAFNVTCSTGMLLFKPVLLLQWPRDCQCNSLSTAMIQLQLHLLFLGRRVSDRYLVQTSFNDAVKMSCNYINLKAQIQIQLNLQCKTPPSFNRITNKRDIQGTTKQAQTWELTCKEACEYTGAALVHLQHTECSKDYITFNNVCMEI